MDSIFILQELNVQADRQYRDRVGKYSRSMRSQNLDISAISRNVHLEWVSGYRRNNSFFLKLCEDSAACLEKSNNASPIQ